MGYTRHHMIVVTGWDYDRVETAHAKAVEIFPAVSGLLAGTTNGYVSFFIPPDGSKGWDSSSQGDDRRHRFMTWLEVHFPEGHLDAVEVMYGGADWGVVKATRIAGIPNEES